MDWCVDLRVAGAADAAVGDIVAHLDRHAQLADVVELAVPLIRQTLTPEAGSPMRWLSIGWDGTSAHLAVAELAADGPWPRPGPAGPPLRALGPGVALANEAVVEMRAATVSGPVKVDLPVVRAPEPDLDPSPLPSARVPADREAFALAALALFAGDDPNTSTPEETAAQFGATVAASLHEQAGRQSATLRDAAEAIVAFERAAGAHFFLVEADDTTAVLGNHQCPFGDAAAGAPALCRITSALAGRLASDTTGRDVSVALSERLALGDHQCRLVLNVGDSDDAASHNYRTSPAGLKPIASTPDPTFARGLQVALSLRLPRDQLSVPLVRRLTRHALQEVGVVDEDRGDVELAVTEAAGNVMDHAGPGDAYDIDIEINPSACEIRVVDVGRGFDHHRLDGAMAETSAEEGRGIALMHALMDQVRFSSHPERGTIVHLVKQLEFDDSAPARALMLAELRHRDEASGAAADPGDRT